MAVLTESIPKVSVSGVNLESYSIIDVVLRKGLLSPAELRFRMRKKKLLRDASDAMFDIAADLMGKQVSVAVPVRRNDQDMKKKEEKLVFSGLVFGADTVRETMGQMAYIEVMAYSPDFMLKDSPHCESFENQTLSQIVGSVLDQSESLFCRINEKIIPSMQEKLHYVVQYNETSYDFLSRLARRYGEYMFFENDYFYFGKKPNGNTIELYPDIDVLGYSYSLNMHHAHFRHAQHDYINYNNDAKDGVQKARQGMHRLNDASFDNSISLFQKETLQDLQSATQEYSPFNQIENSTKVQTLGMKTGMLTCNIRTNRADICLGDVLTIKEYVDDGGISIVKHQSLMAVAIEHHSTIDGHFENIVTAIAADSPYAPYTDPTVYPVCGTQRARVVDNDDPEKLGRVRVQFLWQEWLVGKSISPWLRITQPHGGDDKGFYFVPEVGEEVMVSFVHDNAEKPYVSGTLFHGQQMPGYDWPTSSNDIKAIRTRNGHTVEIHDVAQGGFIRIYDYQKENYILTYSTDEKLIKLESTGNIELYAKHDIIMHAGHDISARADHDNNLSAGHDMQRTAENDIRERAGNNRNTNIDNNDSLNVKENQFVDIGNSKSVEIKHKYQANAETIRTEADEDLYLYSKKHVTEAKEKAYVKASQEININAQLVKVN